MYYTEDGFVDLSSIGKNLRKAREKGILVPNDLCGFFYNGYWLNGEDDTFFLKIPNPFALSKEDANKRIFTELLVEELAIIVGINVIESKIATLNAKKPSLAIISRSYLRNGYHVISGKDIVMEYLSFLEKSTDPFTKKNLLQLYFDENSLDELFSNYHNKFDYNSLEFTWASLLYHFRNSKEKPAIVSSIMQKLTKRYVFEFILMQTDYHLKNWEIQENSSSAFLSPMYDLDMGISEQFDSEKNNSMRSFMEDFSSVYDDFKRFYNNSTVEVKQEVQKQLSLLNPSAIMKSMEIIENNYKYTFPENYKEKFLNIYTAHYEKLKEITRNYHL